MILFGKKVMQSFFLRESVLSCSMQEMTLNLLCCLGWPHTRDHLASACLVLEIKACAIMPLFKDSSFYFGESQCAQEKNNLVPCMPDRK